MFTRKSRMSAALFVARARRYGVAAVLTGQKMRHAARGRAKRAWGYIGAHTSTQTPDYPVTLILERLRQERMA